MRALVVYESMFGNPREVASAVAEGLATRLDVETLEVGRAPALLGPEIALLVVGSPTHAHGMTTPKTRADAAQRAGDRLVSSGRGMADWLEQLGKPGSIAAAAFDTRIKGPSLVWGSAAKGLVRLLTAAEFRLVRPAESFMVGGPTGPLFDRLVPGEVDRARTWGRDLAADVSSLVASHAAPEPR